MPQPEDGVRAVKGAQRASGGAGGKVIIVVVVLVVVVAGAAGWWFFLRSTPEKVVAQYVAAAKAGNEQGATACLSAGTVKALDGLKQAMGAALGPTGSSIKLATSLLVPPTLDMDVEIGKATVQGDTATVAVKLRAKGGAAAGPGAAPGAALAGQSRPLKCVREGGQWKIDQSQELAMASQFMTAFTAGGGLQKFAEKMGREMGQGMQGMAKGLGQASPAPSPLAGATAPGGAPSASGPTTPQTFGGPAALVAAGMAQKAAGHLDAAAAKLNRALQLDPNNCDAHWGLAWVLVDQGKKADAKSHFQKVIELNADPKKTSGAREALARMK
jgi:hypothetical protein